MSPAARLHAALSMHSPLPHTHVRDTRHTDLVFFDPRSESRHASLATCASPTHALSCHTHTNSKAWDHSHKMRLRLHTDIRGGAKRGAKALEKDGEGSVMVGFELNYQVPPVKSSQPASLHTPCHTPHRLGLPCNLHGQHTACIQPAHRMKAVMMLLVGPACLADHVRWHTAWAIEACMIGRLIL